MKSKRTNLHIQEVQQNSKQVNKKRATPKYIVFKLLKDNNKEKNFKQQTK